MHRPLIPLWFVALTMVFIGTNSPCQAHYSVEVIDTYPSGKDINLGLDEPYRLQIKYKTDEPIRIWARPSYQGELVGMMTNASSPYTGQGEALGWFSSRNPAEVDEVKIYVGERGKRGKPVATYPVKIHIGGGASPIETEPAWVASLIEKSNQSLNRDLTSETNQSSSGSDVILMFGLMTAGLSLITGSIVLPIVAFLKWEGGWKVAAAVPMCLTGFVILRIIFGVMIDSTSHNLWPLELIMIGTISIGIIAVLKIVKWFMEKQANA